MKATFVLSACALLASANALTVPSAIPGQAPLGGDGEPSQDLFLLSYQAYGEHFTKWEPEERKWELRRVSL